MKTTKTVTIMSKVLCASALMVPLALPVATQAQSLRATPPVVLRVQAQTAGDPSAVVAAFLGAVQQGRNNADYSAYLSQALEQQVANGTLVSTLLGIQNDYLNFSVGQYTVDGAGRATLTATLNYGVSSYQRPMTLVQEDGAWQIDSIVVAEAPAATPALTPTETVIGFLTAVQQNPAHPAIDQYVGTGRLNERLSNGETVASVLGIQNVYGTFSVQNATLESPGNATVVATLNFENGSVQRTFKVNQGPTWGIRDIVIDQAQPAPSATAAPSTAPSATAAPSTAPSAQPSATAKPSVAASATAAPSSAPSKLPDTGAADTVLGGLLAASAALAASGGYLLRRRAR